MASPRNERRLTHKAIDKAMAAHPCGPCQACCTTMQVQEIGKPEGVPCNRLRAYSGLQSPGCSIYKVRPQSCRDWNCIWRLGLTDEIPGYKGGEKIKARPDKLGLVFDVNDTHATGIQMLVARETVAGAADAAMALLHALCGKGHVIYIIPFEPGANRRMMGPEERVKAVQDAARKRLPLAAQ